MTQSYNRRLLRSFGGAYRRLLCPGVVFARGCARLAVGRRRARRQWQSDRRARLLDLIHCSSAPRLQRDPPPFTHMNRSAGVDIGGCLSGLLISLLRHYIFNLAASLV